MKKVLYIGSYSPHDNTTSSNKFEKSIIKQFYNKYGNDVTFISVSNKPTIDNQYLFDDFNIDNNIELIPIHSDGYLYKRIIKQFYLLSRTMIDWCKTNKDSNKIIFMINSMPNISLPALLMKKLFKCKIVSFTIDTPLPYLETKKGLNYHFSRMYYTMSFKMLHRFNGIILLNERAYEELGLKIPNHISRIGFNLEDYKGQNHIAKTNKKKIITYAGTLVEYNGINQLLSAFEYIHDENVILNIYGDGPLKEKVISVAKRKLNVFYYGLIDNKEIMDLLRKSDIVINPRLSNDKVNNFTFPSKLIEYMLSGAAVLTSRINSIPEEYNEYLYYIDDESPIGISKSILELLRTPQTDIEKKVLSGKEFLYKNQSWEKVVEDIISFITDL